MPLNTQHPSLLLYTRLISRYAKDCSYSARDRRALYALKDQLLRLLFTQGQLQASAVLTAPWDFGTYLRDWGVVAADGLLDAWTDAQAGGEWHAWGPTPPTPPEVQALFDRLLATAEAQQEGIPPEAFAVKGISIFDVPLETPRYASSWEEIGDWGQAQLHPRGRWLIAFSTPDAPDDHLLHAPYLKATPWLPTLPPVHFPRAATYGRPPTPEETSAYPLPFILQELGVIVCSTQFPDLLAQRLKF